MTDKNDIRGRIRLTDKTKVERTISFDVVDIRDALALLGRRYEVPEGAKFTVRFEPNGDMTDGDVRDAEDVSYGYVQDFSFDWTEDAKPKRDQKAAGEAQ